MFSFQKRKQPVPRKVMQGLPVIKEIEMLKETVQRKELSTSTEVEGEGEEEKMVRRADPGAVRQDTKEVDRSKCF